MKPIYLFFIGFFFLASCQLNDEKITSEKEESPLQGINPPLDFDYSTTREVTLKVSTSPAKAFLPVSFLDQEGNLLGTFNTDQKGELQTELALPAWHETVAVQTRKIGWSSQQQITLSGSEEQVVIEQAIAQPGDRSSGSGSRTSANGYQFLGGWDNLGRPDYLEPVGDLISADFLNDNDASLPESRPVPQFNPEYLVEQDMNTRLQEMADIWITFVHEGAGWKNALGFYTYPLDAPPATANDIDSLKIILPNVSYNGSGGNLQSGDKVYLGRYPANTGIGWFLVPNGWDANSQSVLQKSDTKFSVKNYNTFASADFRQHCILLNDQARELLLLGFEDTTRPAGDNDFNDAIFYVSANPYTAIITDGLQAVQQAVDTDGDGVFDHEEEFPNDPTKAFTAYYPSASTYASLAFEDLWPSQGDYDFNDLVLDYRYQRILSSNYRVQEFNISLKVLAIGGYYRNGFGIELPVGSEQVVSVNGGTLNKGIVQLNPNGTESGQSNAVVFAFEDAFSVMNPPAGKMLVNAEENAPYVAPVLLDISVDLQDNLISNNTLSGGPFNPFIFVNGERGKEVHLPGKAATDLADPNYLGTQDDNGIQPYTTSKNYPWALHLGSSFEHPLEERPITSAYLKFSSWAESGGGQFSDWLQNKAGYRNTQHFFKK